MYRQVIPSHTVASTAAPVKRATALEWLILALVVVSVALNYVDRRNPAVTTGLAHSFVVLFALRLLLGISESIAYPAYSKIIDANFSEQRRGLASGLIDVGCRFGPAKIRATPLLSAPSNGPGFANILRKRETWGTLIGLPALCGKPSPSVGWWARRRF